MWTSVFFQHESYNLFFVDIQASAKSFEGQEIMEVLWLRNYEEII